MVGRSPPKIVLKTLKFICVGIGSKDTFLGRLPILPSVDLSKSTFRMEERKQLAYTVPTVFAPNLRLVTARELLVSSKLFRCFINEFHFSHLIRSMHQMKYLNHAKILILRFSFNMDLMTRWPIQSFRNFFMKRQLRKIKILSFMKVRFNNQVQLMIDIL